MKNLIILSILFITGCVSVPITHDSNNLQKTYNVNYETAWQASIKMLSQESIPFQNIDKENGLINTGYIQDTYLFYKARYTLNFFLYKVDDGHTRITINPNYEAYFPGQVLTNQNGEWKNVTKRNEKLANEYFKYLDRFIASPV